MGEADKEMRYVTYQSESSMKYESELKANLRSLNEFIAKQLLYS